MIFITLGTQNFQTDNLLQNLDVLISDGYLSEEVICQCPYQEYTPINFRTIKAISYQESELYLKSATIVITHAGTGSLISCEKAKRKYVVYPRSADLGEHVDNHQHEMARVFESNGNACVVKGSGVLDLKNAIKCSLEESPLKIYPTGNQELVNSIISDIEEY